MVNIPKWINCDNCKAKMCFTCAVKIKENPYINFEENINEGEEAYVEHLDIYG
jgi:ferredoxin